MQKATIAEIREERARGPLGGRGAAATGAGTPSSARALDGTEEARRVEREVAEEEEALREEERGPAREDTQTRVGKGARGPQALGSQVPGRAS